jgi:hypothetical protein
MAPKEATNVTTATTWIPALVSRRRARAHLEASLLQNLDRIPTGELTEGDDVASGEELVSAKAATSPGDGRPDAQEANPESSDRARHSEIDAEQRIDLYSRMVSELGEQLLSGSDPPKKTLARWIGLLKELDREHEQGRIDAEDVCRLNSELLEMIPMP